MSAPLTAHQTATSHYFAPSGLAGKWSQLGMKRVAEDWLKSCPDKYARLDGSVGEDGPSIWGGIGFEYRPDGLGQYGHFTHYELGTTISPDIPDSSPSRTLAEEYADAWIDQILEAIREEQANSVFSPTEFVTYLGDANPDYSERWIADALGVTVETVRGTMRRIKQKLGNVQHAKRLQDEVDFFRKNATGHCAAAPDALIHVGEDRFPVDAREIEHRDGQYLVTPLRTGEDFFVDTRTADPYQ